MLDHTPRDSATSNVLAWSAHSANVEPSVEEDAGADVDEPPERERNMNASQEAGRFEKTAVRRGQTQHESLLTKALQSHSEDETYDSAVGLANSRRRRSMTSNVSFASTAELTTDTGITTPARTSSPSPHLQDAPGHIGFAGALRGSLAKGGTVPASQSDSRTPVGQETVPAAPQPEKKRCISFACAAKPVRNDASTMPPPPPPKTDNTGAKPPAQDAPPRPCIKFACPSRPRMAAPTTPPKREEPQKLSIKISPAVDRSGSPVAARKLRSPSVGYSRSSRSATPRRSGQSPAPAKKYLSAESQDLQCESSRFHEFASDEPQEDDWIRQDKYTARRRLTIDDTLKMELAIRRLGKEAEEEAEQEEEEDEDETAETPVGDDDNDEEDDDDIEEDGDEEEDDNSGYGSDDDVSDGYKTDNEVGFASSDDEDDDLILWTTRRPAQSELSGDTPVVRRLSMGEHSDSSGYSLGRIRSSRPKNRELVGRFRPGTPELPDSTDFVCGTLDEDRPLEEAYKSCIAARKLEKLHLIPQDIDPSFPTSEPEDGDDNETYKPAHDDDEHLWLHGELEDLHHEKDRADRRKKKGDSPKRYHSPPPKRHHSPPVKRHHSPPPKIRGRSPRRLFDHHSPTRRMRSPAPPHAVSSPPASPVQARQGIAFKALAFRPGLTHTKSLPRAPAVFPHMKQNRKPRANTITKTKHVRGAIDIVKGLEQKRQRRREKFQLKYCNRARKGLVHEKRPQPGQGAERMRELGLLMAGKVGQGNYVLSF